MKSNFQDALAHVFEHEGGYVDHPRDPGGATNFGITHETLARWRNQPVTKAQVKALTKTEAGQIYRARYWSTIRGDELPSGIDLAMFDYAVNSGPRRAIEHMQDVLGVVSDGVIGPKTMAAIQAHDTTRLIQLYMDKRIAFLRRLPTWGTFGKGWTSRVSAVRAAALKLAGKPTQTQDASSPAQPSTNNPYAAPAKPAGPIASTVAMIVIIILALVITGYLTWK